MGKTCRTQEGHFSWPARRRGAAHPPPFRHNRRRAPDGRRSGHPWAAALPLVDLGGLLALAPRGWRAPTTPAGDMWALGAHSGSTPPSPSPQPSPHQRRRGALCRGRWLYRRAWAGPGEHGGRRGGDADIWPAAAESMQPRHSGRGELIFNGIAVPVRDGAPCRCGVALARVAPCRRLRFRVSAAFVVADGRPRAGCVAVDEGHGPIVLLWTSCCQRKAPSAMT